MQTKSKSKTIIIVIGSILISAVIGLSIALTVIELKRQSTDVQLSNLYEKSYHETLDTLDSVSTKLEKVEVLTGVVLRQELLDDIWRECDIAIINLNQMSESSESLAEATKILNQIGDYCHYLSKKLNVTSITDEEIANLETFHTAITSISTALGSVQDQMINGEEIDTSILSSLTSVTDSIGTIDYSTVSYPELIYDGPFSDGLDDREAKFLIDKEEISVERGVELIGTYFVGATDIVNDGESSGSIPCYIYNFMLNNLEGSAYISKVGGYVILYNSYCEITDPTLTDDECVQKASEYMEILGYSNMKPVWVSNNNSTVYINFAYYDEQEIIYYPDLIKIKICSQNGSLIGVESQNYIYNHTVRDLTLPENIDHINISASLSVQSQEYCLIPTDWNSEVLCLEVVATKDETTYYIYYNVETGEEERVLIVIDEDGKLLI
jgi:germination protein YpeB